MFSHEPIEWPDEVEVLVDRLETESAERIKVSVPNGTKFGQVSGIVSCAGRGEDVMANE
jgi:hypothetical protein